MPRPRSGLTYPTSVRRETWTRFSPGRVACSRTWRRVTIQSSLGPKPEIGDSDISVRSSRCTRSTATTDTDTWDSDTRASGTPVQIPSHRGVRSSCPFTRAGSQCLILTSWSVGQGPILLANADSREELVLIPKRFQTLDLVRNLFGSTPGWLVRGILRSIRPNITYLLSWESIIGTSEVWTLNLTTRADTNSCRHTAATSLRAKSTFLTATTASKALAVAFTSKTTWAYQYKIAMPHSLYHSFSERLVLLGFCIKYRRDTWIKSYKMVWWDSMTAVRFFWTCKRWLIKLSSLKGSGETKLLSEWLKKSPLEAPYTICALLLSILTKHRSLLEHRVSVLARLSASTYLKSVEQIIFSSYWLCCCTFQCFYFFIPY